jgi:hypothetical protein
MNKDWVAPLTGIGAVALVVAGFAIAGEPPDVEEPAIEIVEHYVDNDDSVMIGSAMAAWGAVLLVFFANHLRGIFRRAEGASGTLSAVTLVGAAILATGIGIDSSISFALAEGAEHIEPEAAQSLQALWDNDFMPMAIGMALFLLSSGISVVRHRVLPAWLGWVLIVVSLTVITPIGFVGFIGGGILILVVSVMGLLRRDADSAPAA